MPQSPSFSPSLAVAAAWFLGAILSNSAWAIRFDVDNLVTDDQTAHTAQIADPNLKNGWGMSFSPTGPFSVSSNGGHSAVSYNVNPDTHATSIAGPAIAIPGSGNVTAQVYNGNAAAFNGDSAVFVSKDGTISGWRPSLGTAAETLVTASSDNVYTGATIATQGGDDYLYAANFKAGTIDIYKGTGGPTQFAGSFPGYDLPAGYAPFNVQNLNGDLYITYALRNDATYDPVPGLGRGFVDQVTLDFPFVLVMRIVSGGTLDAPWGVAFAPSSYFPIAGSLLVGNSGDGHINVYTRDFRDDFVSDGQLLDENGQPIAIDGLRAIAFGNDGSAGNGDRLYFTAGPDDQVHGLFGAMVPAALVPIPEPSAYAMLLAGLGLVMLLAGRGRFHPIYHA